MTTLRQWLIENKLEEKLIITDNKENIIRLFRRFNLDGIDLCNVNVNTVTDLANSVLAQKYCRNSYQPMRILDDNAAALLLQKIVTNHPEDYSFIPKQCYSIGTFSEVLRILKIIRISALTDEYANSTDGKIQQIKSLINVYEQNLKDKELMDPVMVIRESIGTKTGFICEKPAVVYFGHLSQLERRFIERHFSNAQILNYEEDNSHSVSFTKAYGIYNEIKCIADIIHEKKYRFGDVSVIYSNREYDAFIETVFKEQKIDFAFSRGKSAQSDNLVSLMRSLMVWISYDFDYAYLRYVVAENGFNVYGKNKIEEELCNPLMEYNSCLRCNFCFGAQRYLDDSLWNINSHKNNIFKDAIQKIVGYFVSYKDKVPVGKLLKDLAECACEYCGAYDKKDSRYHRILKMAESLSVTEVEMELNEALRYLSERLKQLTFTQSADNTMVDVAIVSDDVYVQDRKHTFIVGLSDKSFTASVVESPVLSDAEIRKYLADVPLASDHETRHQQAFNSTIASIRGDIRISYADFSTVDMRAQAPSAYLASLLEKEGKTVDEIDEYHAYKDKLACCLINSPQNIVTPDGTVKGDIANDNTIVFSPTSLNMLMKCPLKYYYQFIRKLNMDEPVENSEIQWLQANETGTFFHNLMENYMNEEFKENPSVFPVLNKPRFDRIYEIEKEKTIENHPSLNDTRRDYELDRLKNAAYKYLQKMHAEFSHPSNPWIVEACEMKLEEKDFHIPISENGVTLDIKIKGTADRVDYRIDEKGIRHYRIVDYKTGKRKTQADKVKNGETCQHDLYSMVIAKMGKVDEFDYVFPFERKNDLLAVTDFENQIPKKARKAIVEFYIEQQIVPDQKKKKDNLGCEYCPLRHCCMFYTTREEEED